MNEQPVPDDVELPRTGDEAVDAALALLAGVDPQGPPSEHLPVLAAAHEALQQRLAAAAE